MKVSREILPTACYMLLLTACASNPLVVDTPIKITPILAKSSSDNPDAMYRTGRYYQGQNRYELAIDAYQKALAANSGFVEAFNGLGVIYAKQMKYDEAIDAFQSAIRLNPKAAHILNNLGYVYFLQGNYDGSVKVLEQSIAIDPTNKRSLNNLGLVYAMTGHTSDAKNTFSKADSDPLAVADSNFTNKQTSPLSSPQLESNFIGKVSNPEEQTLSLPKNRGIIKHTSTPSTLLNLLPADNNSRVKMLQVSPYVYELHINSINSNSIPIKDAGKFMRRLRIEVSNGNGVTGFARKIGNFLKSQGYSQSRLTNQKHYNITNTQIQYREGYQSDAEHLQASFSQEFELIERNDLRPDVNLRILLGKDIALKGH